MPPKRMRNNRRFHRGGSRIEAKIRTLEQELRTVETGRWSKKSSCIQMRPYIWDAKMFLTVRLQNTSGTSPWEPTINSVMQVIEPAYLNMQIISFKLYGPFVSGATTLLDESSGATWQL